MTEPRYQDLAARTEAPITEELLQRLQVLEHQEVFRDLLTEVRSMETLADSIKRQVFYGKPQGLLDPKPCCPVEGEAPPLWEGIHARLLHAALGKLTEAAEQYAAVLKLVAAFRYGEPTKPIIDNIKEETSDSQWYDALTCNALGVDLRDIQDANIRKLAARYGDKFSDVRAIERDTAAEMKAFNND